MPMPATPLGVAAAMLGLLVSVLKKPGDGEDILVMPLVLGLDPKPKPIFNPAGLTPSPGPPVKLVPEPHGLTFKFAPVLEPGRTPW